MVSCALAAATARAAPAGAGDADDARDDFVLDTLARDDYVWAQRAPALVAMKLVKMPRSPFSWLRGTGAVF